MKTLFLYSVLLLSVILISCKKSTEPAQNSNKIYVEVKNENGQAIEGVGLHFYADIIPIPFSISKKPKKINIINSSNIVSKLQSNSNSIELGQNYPNPFNPATTIPFTVPVREHINISILDRTGSTIITTLVDTVLSAGYWHVIWRCSNDNGEYITNNLYTYRLSNGDSSISKQLFFNTVNPQGIKSLNCIPLSTTNSKGRIEINFDKFPVGDEVVWTDETARELGILTIPETLSLFFIKNGYQSKTEEVVLNEGKIVNLSVVLSAE